jgi:hypothetical protein
MDGHGKASKGKCGVNVYARCRRSSSRGWERLMSAARKEASGALYTRRRMGVNGKGLLVSSPGLCPEPPGLRYTGASLKSRVEGCLQI